ncbi:VOC family protein [Tsukamurella sp. 8F]|uniref:VOC family protein n=1 Tax=unclassified Tsukamurella TaxID=2633480 RepID=UPI0023B901E9|nr:MULTISPECIES: VOC family protein [unclassified Tsukamurella]MDF0530624.1 VOC family protein [Tsukamurella sp. 8J]MDF0587825.1 VOC family protein [Tsukamurella sp. 8F]
MPTPRLNAIGIVADDLPASLAFYRSCGLDIPAEADAAPHVDVALPGGVRLMFDALTTVHSFDPGWTRAAGGSSPFALAFDCGAPRDVDAVVAALARAGHRVLHEPWDAFWGHRYASVLDPDGNQVDFYAPLS